MTIKSDLYKFIFGPAAATFLLLLIPLIAMQFTNEVNWTIFDFVVAAILLFGTGFTYKLLTSKVKSFTQKAAIIVAIGSSLFLVWTNLAVGIIGSEDNPVNIIYFFVIGIGIAGAVMSRFKSRGLSLTMFAIAIILLLIAFAVLIYAWTQSDDFKTNELMAYIGFHGLFILLFFISGVLFRQAAQDEAGLEKVRDR